MLMRGSKHKAACIGPVLASAEAFDPAPAGALASAEAFKFYSRFKIFLVFLFKQFDVFCVYFII